jgi:hypothetical protein
VETGSTWQDWAEFVGAGNTNQALSKSKTDNLGTQGVTTMKKTVQKTGDEQRANLAALHQQLQEMAETAIRNRRGTPTRDIEVRAPVLVIRGK